MLEVPGSLQLNINGVLREFATLQDGATLAALVTELGFRPDRVALEQNGDIVPRTRWAEATVREGDRLEVVHFVGGGTALEDRAVVRVCSSVSHLLP